MQTSSEQWRQRLVLPAYSVADAARYAVAHPNTVSAWFSSQSRLGPTLGSRQRGQALSYMQLVEVAFVASFRRIGLKMSTIRKTRNFLAESFRSDFPFAHQRLITDGTHIMLDLKDVDPDPNLDLLIMADAAGQGAWPSVISDRFLQFEYQEGLAIRWWPRGLDFPVVIDPRISFGAPSVQGVPTWVLKGRLTAGETVDQIAEDFELSPELVTQALLFERRGGAA